MAIARPIGQGAHRWLRNSPSEGEFVPFSAEKTGDAEDGYDSVEWLATHPYCNGTLAHLGLMQRETRTERARHRNSLEREELLTPGPVTEVHIALGPTAFRFLAGHRVRLEIRSSDFPNHDRNHNTGGDDLADTELVVATQEVHHSTTYPSRLILPLR